MKPMRHPHPARMLLSTRIKSSPRLGRTTAPSATSAWAKLRIKVSGCIRSMAGAGEFCAIRSYLATAARHDISALDALTQAFQGSPWIPETGYTSPSTKAPARCD